MWGVRQDCAEEHLHRGLLSLMTQTVRPSQPLSVNDVAWGVRQGTGERRRFGAFDGRRCHHGPPGPPSGGDFTISDAPTS
jgi:hypothetical protein